MAAKRKSTEAGHRRKFLVVIDDTPECSRALTFAARRAERTGGGLVLLYVIVPNEFKQWVGVENIMRAEAMQEAEETLGRFADMARTAANVEPQQVIREGGRADEILKLIETDEDIAVLVLAAGGRQGGPRPAGHGHRRQGLGDVPGADHHRSRPSRRRGDRRARLSRGSPSRP